MGGQLLSGGPWQRAALSMEEDGHGGSPWFLLRAETSLLPGCFCPVSGGGSSMESSQSQLTSCLSGTTTQSLRNGPMRSLEFLLMTSEKHCKCYIVSYRFIHPNKMLCCANTFLGRCKKRSFSLQK